MEQGAITPRAEARCRPVALRGLHSPAGWRMLKHERADPAVNHVNLDQISLALGRRVAERLRRQPELLDEARANLSRWSRRNASVATLLRCYAEWQELLERPVDDICALLCAETDEAQRLRQNSPFAGVLSPTEVWAIKASFRHATDVELPAWHGEALRETGQRVADGKEVAVEWETAKRELRERFS